MTTPCSGSSGPNFELIKETTPVIATATLFALATYFTIPHLTYIQSLTANRLKLVQAIGSFASGATAAYIAHRILGPKKPNDTDHTPQLPLPKIEPRIVVSSPPAQRFEISLPPQKTQVVTPPPSDSELEETSYYETSVAPSSSEKESSSSSESDEEELPAPASPSSPRNHWDDDADEDNNCLIQ